MFFKRTDNLTANLTSYDLLKSFTVLFMFVDHIGAYFIPDELWWRVFGRLGFVAWFFLAGYSKSKEVGTNLWVGAGLLIAVNVIFGGNMLALNALVSFICIRVFMTSLYQKYFSNFELLIYATSAFILLAIPTNYIFEYGTLAFLLAMFGYAVRNKQDIGVHRYVMIGFCVLVAVVAGLIQNVTFGFDLVKSVVCSLIIGAMCIWLYQFKRLEFPNLTQRMPKVVTALIQFCGRYTLEIYVIHIALIKIYLFFADTEGNHQFLTPTMFF